MQVPNDNGSRISSTVTFQAVHVYKGNASKCQLSFKRGDFIVCDAAHVSENKGGGWLWGTCNSVSGWFPPKFVKQVETNTHTKSQEKANIQNGSVVNNAADEDDPFAGLPLADAVVPEHQLDNKETITEKISSSNGALANGVLSTDQNGENKEITGDFGETTIASLTSIAADTGKGDAVEDEEDFGDFDNGVKQLEEPGEKFGSFDDADATEEQYQHDKGDNKSPNREPTINQNDGPRTLELPSPDKLGHFLLNSSYISNTNEEHLPPSLPFIRNENTTTTTTDPSDPSTSDFNVITAVHRHQEGHDRCTINDFSPQQQVFKKLRDFDTSSPEENTSPLDTQNKKIDGHVAAAASSATAFELPSPEKLGLFATTLDGYYHGEAPQVPFLEVPLTTASKTKETTEHEQNNNNTSMLPLSSANQFVSFDRSKMESFYSVKESFGTSTSSNIGEVTNDQQHEEEEESPIVSAGEEHFIDAVEDEEDFGSFDDGHKVTTTTTINEIISAGSTPCKFENTDIEEEFDGFTESAEHNVGLNQAHGEDEFGDFNEGSNQNHELTQRHDEDKMNGVDNYAELNLGLNEQYHEDDEELLPVPEVASLTDDFGSFDGEFLSPAQSPSLGDGDDKQHFGQHNKCLHSGTTIEDKIEENGSDNIAYASEDAYCIKSSPIAKRQTGNTMKSSNMTTLELPSPTKLGYFVEEASTATPLEDVLGLPFEPTAIGSQNCFVAEEKKHCNIVSGVDTDDNITDSSTAIDVNTSTTIGPKCTIFELPSPEKLGYSVEVASTHHRDASVIPVKAAGSTCADADDENLFAVIQDPQSYLTNKSDRVDTTPPFDDGVLSSRILASGSNSAFPLDTYNAATLSEPEKQTPIVEVRQTLARSNEQKIKLKSALSAKVILAEKTSEESSSDVIVIDGDETNGKDQFGFYEAQKLKLNLEISPEEWDLSAANLQDSAVATPRANLAALFDNDELNEEADITEESEELQDFDQVVCEENKVKAEEVSQHAINNAEADDASYWDFNRRLSQFTDSPLPLDHQTAAAICESFTVGESSATEKEVDEDFGDFQSDMRPFEKASKDGNTPVQASHGKKEFDEPLKDSYSSLSGNTVKGTIESPSASQRVLREIDEARELEDFGDFGTAPVELNVEEVGAPEIHVDGGEFGDFADFSDAIQRQTENSAALLAHPGFIEAALEDSSFVDFTQPDVALGGHISAIEEDHDINPNPKPVEQTFKEIVAQNAIEDDDEFGEFAGEEKDFTEDSKYPHSSFAERTVKETLDSPRTSRPFLNETFEIEDFGFFDTAPVELKIEEVGAPEIHMDGDEFGDFADFGDAIKKQTENKASLATQPGFTEAALEDSSFGDFTQPDVALGAHITTIEEDRDIMDAKAVFKSIFPLAEEDISYSMKEFCPSLLSKQFLVEKKSRQSSGWAERTLLECFADIKQKPDIPASIICVPSTSSKHGVMAQRNNQPQYCRVVKNSESPASIEETFAF